MTGAAAGSKYWAVCRVRRSRSKVGLANARDVGGELGGHRILDAHVRQHCRVARVEALQAAAADQERNGLLTPVPAIQVTSLPGIPGRAANGSPQPAVLLSMVVCPILGRRPRQGSRLDPVSTLPDPADFASPGMARAREAATQRDIHGATVFGSSWNQSWTECQAE